MIVHQFDRLAAVGNQLDQLLIARFFRLVSFGPQDQVSVIPLADMKIFSFQCSRLLITLFEIDNEFPRFDIDPGNKFLNQILFLMLGSVS